MPRVIDKRLGKLFKINKGVRYTPHNKQKHICLCTPHTHTHTHTSFVPRSCPKNWERSLVALPCISVNHFLSKFWGANQIAEWNHVECDLVTCARGHTHTHTHYTHLTHCESSQIPQQTLKSHCGMGESATYKASKEGLLPFQLYYQLYNPHNTHKLSDSRLVGCSFMHVHLWASCFYFKPFQLWMRELTKLRDHCTALHYLWTFPKGSRVSFLLCLGRLWNQPNQRKQREKQFPYSWFKHKQANLSTPTAQNKWK